MKKSIITIIAFVLIQNAYGQTLIGINMDLGNSKITNGFMYNLSPENVIGGNAIGLAINTNFNTSKRFNPILNLGFINKKSTAIRELTYFEVDNNGMHTGNLISENLTTTTSINGLKLDVGVRFNILNNKNKFFIEASVCNNYILDIQNKRNATTGFSLSTSYSTKATPPFYVSLPLGIGYNYNNMFSVTFIYNPALTYYEGYSQSKVNMYGLNLCYYLPILGNKKVKAEKPANP